MIVPLSIEIPVDDPTRPKIRLHKPCSSNAHTWNPRVFDEGIMSEILQDTHNISDVFRWLYKRMMGTEAYLIHRNAKRSRQNMDDNYDDLNDYKNIKNMKMEIDG